jgi:hypothetical protein
MYTKSCKSYIPLHLQVAYLSGFKKGVGGGQRVCNLIYRSLFYYYSDLFYLLPSTTPHPVSLLPFTLTYILLYK